MGRRIVARWLPVAVVAAIAWGGPPRAARAGVMVSVTIAGNTKTGLGELSFTNADFKDDKSGYVYSGKVETFNGTIAAIIRLLDFSIEVPPTGKGGTALNIAFKGEGFDSVKGSKVKAQDTIAGNFNNRLGKHVLGDGNSVEYQGYAQAKGAKAPGVAIRPPNAPFKAAPPGGTSFAVPFGGGHGPMILDNDKPWTLLGDLTVTLGVAGDRIAKAPVPPAPEFGATVSLVGVPEPSGPILVGAGLALAAGLARRRGARAVIPRRATPRRPPA